MSVKGFSGCGCGYPSGGKTKKSLKSKSTKKSHKSKKTKKSKGGW